MSEPRITAVVLANDVLRTKEGKQFLCLEQVAGLSPLARAVKSARHNQAGRMRLVLSENSPGERELTEEARKAWGDHSSFEKTTIKPSLGDGEAIVSACQPGNDYLLVLFADVAFDPKLTKKMIEELKTLSNERYGWVAGDKLPALLLLPVEMARQLGPGALSAQLDEIERNGRLRRLPQEDGFTLRLRTSDDIKLATSLQVKALRRPTDGIISRWLNRPVSLWLSKNIFCRTALTPNQITFIAALVGWVGIGLVLWWKNYWWTVLGAALFHISSVLDGCDGEVARLRFQFSRFGEWFDNVLDEVNNALFIGAIGLGIWHRGGHEVYAWAAAFHLVTVFLVDSATFYQLIRYRGGSGSIDNMRWFFQKSTNAVALAFSNKSSGSWIMQMVRRDFYIFLLLVLAIFDILHFGFWLSITVDLALFVLGLGQWVWQLSSKGRESLCGEKK